MTPIVLRASTPTDRPRIAVRIAVRIAAQVALASTALVVALFAVAATPRAACACSTKQPILLLLPRTLERIAEHQRGFLADSGRFAQLEELRASGWFGSSPTLEMKEYVVTDSTLRAVVWAPTISDETSCVLTMRADGGPPEQSCVNMPEKGKAERRVALIYFAVLILAVGIRVALAGRSHAPIGIATVALTGLPFFLHPFWGIERYSSWCDELVPVGYLWVAFAGMYLVRNAFFGSYEPPEPPRPRSNAPPRRPDGSREFR